MNKFLEEVDKILNEASTSNLEDIVKELALIVSDGDLSDRIDQADYKTKKEAAKILGRALSLLKGI